MESEVEGIIHTCILYNSDMGQVARGAERDMKGKGVREEGKRRWEVRGNSGRERREVRGKERQRERVRKKRSKI